MASSKQTAGIAGAALVAAALSLGMSAGTVARVERAVKRESTLSTNNATARDWAQGEQPATVHVQSAIEQRSWPVAELNQFETNGTEKITSMDGMLDAMNGTWRAWLEETHPGRPDCLYKAIEHAITEVDGPDGAAICALLEVESTCSHWDGMSIKRGRDSEIGIAQIKLKPWESLFSTATNKTLDLRDIRDNIFIAANILNMSGWRKGSSKAQTRAYGYYNTGKENTVNDYALTVHHLAEQIRGFGGSQAK